MDTQERAMPWKSETYRNSFAKSLKRGLAPLELGEDVLFRGISFDGNNFACDHKSCLLFPLDQRKEFVLRMTPAEVDAIIVGGHQRNVLALAWSVVFFHARRLGLETQGNVRACWRI